jgi:hypothetical protein
MSGSSNTFSYDFRTQDISCEKLIFNTQLASPKEPVISQLSEGDVLEVSISQHGGQVIVFAIWDGQVAGGIASEYLPRLRTCLQGGTDYIATVRSIVGGQVHVRVSPRRAA